MVKKTCQYEVYIPLIICHLEELICMITTLEDLICQQGEDGMISSIVNNSAIVLFNTMVKNQFITTDNLSNQLIIEPYNGTTTQNAFYFGIKLYDDCERLQKAAVKDIFAFNDNTKLSIDKLTVTGETYIPVSILDSQIITYTEALCNLKNHFKYVIQTLKTLVRHNCKHGDEPSKKDDRCQSSSKLID